MKLRDLAFGVAAAVAVVGLLAVFTSAIDASQLAVGRHRPLLGVATTAVGAGLLARWYRTEPTAHEPPERERVAPLPAAGDDFDELLSLASARSDDVSRFYRSRARERLEPVGVAVLATHTDCSPEEARTRLLSGTWTDDPVAARFFVSGSDVADGVRGILSTAAGSNTATTRRARRAVAELRRIAAGEGDR